MNIAIRQLEDNLIAVLNASDLPIEVKRLILGNIGRLVDREAENAIRQELSESKPVVEQGEMEDAESA